MPSKITQRQKFKLISFMESHEFLVGGGTGAGVTNSEKDRYWVKLTNILNSLGDTKKSVKQWKKTWTDLKLEAKKRLRHTKDQEKQNLQLNPEGLSSEDIDWINTNDHSKLEDWNERILALLAPSMVEDIINSSEVEEERFATENNIVSLDMEAISITEEQSYTEELSIIEEDVVDDFRVPEDIAVNGRFAMTNSYNNSQNVEEIEIDERYHSQSNSSNSQQNPTTERQDDHSFAEFHKPSTLNLNGNLAENFTQFKEEVMIFFTATETNKKPRDVQVARLKNLLGPDGRKLYNTLHDGMTTETSVYMLDLLEKHCTSRANDTLSMYQVMMRKQKPEEGFDHFYMDLRKMVKQCQLENQEQKLLKALIVQGVRSGDVRERLLQRDMSLEQMVQLCQSAESVGEAPARRDANKVHAINGVSQSKLKSLTAATNDRTRSSNEQCSNLLEVKNRKVAALEVIAAAESKKAEAMTMAAAALQGLAVHIGRVADTLETYVPEQ